MTDSLRVVQVSTDDDLARWIGVRSTCAPWLSTTLAAAVHARESQPLRTDLIAVRDDRLVGAGSAEPIPMLELSLHGAASFYVLPDVRGHGVGTALYQALSARLAELGKSGIETIASEADRDGIDWLTRRSFVECERYADAALELAGRALEPIDPPGDLRITSVDREPDLVAAVFALTDEVWSDIPVAEPIDPPTFEAWHAREVADPEHRNDGFLVAVAPDGAVAGYATMVVSPARPDIGVHGVTGVARAWRGRGVAGALKRAHIAWAVSVGLTRLETENELRNIPIRRLNAGLGYRPLPERVCMRGPLA